MARTPQEAYEVHAQDLGTGDLEKIAAGYSDDCILIVNGRASRGKVGAKEGFAEIFSELAAAGGVKRLEATVRTHHDNVLYLEWWADLGDNRCDGVDTFIFDDGLITVHTVKYEISNAG